MRRSQLLWDSDTVLHNLTFLQVRLQPGEFMDHLLREACLCLFGVCERVWQSHMWTVACSEAGYFRGAELHIPSVWIPALNHRLNNSSGQQVSVHQVNVRNRESLALACSQQTRWIIHPPFNAIIKHASQACLWGRTFWSFFSTRFFFKSTETLQVFDLRRWNGFLSRSTEH